MPQRSFKPLSHRMMHYGLSRRSAPRSGARLIPRSIFFNETAKAQLLDAFATMLPYATVDPQINAVIPLLYNQTEGATSVLPACREALWQVVFTAETSWNATDTEQQEVFSLVDSLTQPLRDVAPASGAYMNEAFIYEPEFETAFWGDNYPRLLALEHKFDPNGLLDCWHCVGWHGARDERYSDTAVIQNFLRDSHLSHKFLNIPTLPTRCAREWGAAIASSMVGAANIEVEYRTRARIAGDLALRLQI
ncbi:hypothetical protein K438DRAFT_1790707 [Mycena galopus ATCC 62051]|nr:hypothetical protein K438DRAFT_1790707 [Mycena galopus ATCC 62051]